MIGKITQLKSGIMKTIKIGGLLAVCAVLLFSKAQQKVKAASLPFMSISNSSVLEGDSGTRTMMFAVTLSEPSTTNVTVRYSTFSWFNVNSATAAPKATTPGGDYVTQTNKLLTFLPGQVQKNLVVTVIGDAISEYDEQFSVELLNPVGAIVIDGSASGTILSDDSTSGFRLGIGDASIRTTKSKNLNVSLTVTFSSPAPSAFSLTAQTISGTAVGVSKATIPGGDFLAATKKFSVLAGRTQQVVAFTIFPDLSAEGTEQFTVQLTSTLGSVIKDRATVEIRDPNATYSREGRRDGPPRVTLIGDSITANYQETAAAMLESKGFQVIKHGEPATSILDANKCNGQLANSILDNDDPDIVVFENIGNYNLFPPCSPLLTINSPDFFAKWQQESQQNTDILTSRGAKFYWIINPSVPSSNQERHTTILQINQFYDQIAISTANTFSIDAWTPFGGDPPDCSLRDPGVSPCLHLLPNGQQLMANLVNTAVGNP